MLPRSSWLTITPAPELREVSRRRSRAQPWRWRNSPRQSVGCLPPPWPAYPMGLEYLGPPPPRNCRAVDAEGMHISWCYGCAAQQKYGRHLAFWRERPGSTTAMTVQRWA